MSTPFQHASLQKREAAMAPSTSVNPSPRRILGDVTNSARNTPRKPNAVANGTGKATPVGSPLKQKQTSTPAAMLSTKGSHDQLALGSSKKRPFETMDDAEDDADAERRSPYRIMTVGPSPHLARVARPPIITIMPLPDDNSSTDEDGDSPLHQREPSEDIFDAEPIAEPLCGSFSSLIDYDPANASDVSARASLEPVNHGEQIPSRAEMLKLRLKIAMYKVKTDQAHVPFSNLLLPQKEPAEPDQSSDDEDDIILEIKPSQGARGAGNLTTEAPANIVITGGPVSKLLPPPVLLPTAFSSRFISAPVTSSPPRPMDVTPLSPRAVIDLDDIATPNVSPEKGYAKRMADDGKDLTSSVVKGRAASGLLELMKAR